MVFQSQAEALSWNVSFYAITQIVINQGFKAIYSLLPDVRWKNYMLPILVMNQTSFASPQDGSFAKQCTRPIQRSRVYLEEDLSWFFPSCLPVWLHLLLSDNRRTVCRLLKGSVVFEGWSQAPACLHTLRAKGITFEPFYTGTCVQGCHFLWRRWWKHRMRKCVRLVFTFCFLFLVHRKLFWTQKDTTSLSCPSPLNAKYWLRFSYEISKLVMIWDFKWTSYQKRLAESLWDVSKTSSVLYTKCSHFITCVTSVLLHCLSFWITARIEDIFSIGCAYQSSHFTASANRGQRSPRKLLVAGLEGWSPAIAWLP